mmetsp:Transcript_3641/g.9206  ORF Transcript_3641/g.9206 Transcript_3641/m.9206 type:complete len:249 (-) Transcript_3641:214-960(-)
MSPLSAAHGGRHVKAPAERHQRLLPRDALERQPADLSALSTAPHARPGGRRHEVLHQRALHGALHAVQIPLCFQPVNAGQHRSEDKQRPGRQDGDAVVRELALLRQRSEQYRHRPQIDEVQPVHHHQPLWAALQEGHERGLHPARCLGLPCAVVKALQQQRALLAADRERTQHRAGSGGGGAVRLRRQQERGRLAGILPRLGGQQRQQLQPLHRELRSPRQQLLLPDALIHGGGAARPRSAAPQPAPP